MRFPFALAAYARDKRGLALRTSALALYVEAVAHPATKGSGLARRYAPRVLRRADEPAEAIAYFMPRHTGHTRLHNPPPEWAAFLTPTAPA